jgi:hypothetical protein
MFAALSFLHRGAIGQHTAHGRIMNWLYGCQNLTHPKHAATVTDGTPDDETEPGAAGVRVPWLVPALPGLSLDTEDEPGCGSMVGDQICQIRRFFGFKARRCGENQGRTAKW